MHQELAGVVIDLTGTLENGKLASLAGTVQGPGGSYVIEASVVDNGGGYTITGSGALAAGPLEGSVTAEIETDPAFNINPDSLNISGEVTINQDLGGTLIDFSGAMENNRLVNLAGTITGPSEMFIIGASVEDNGEGYTITGQGDFALGPVQGSANAQIETDSLFNINPDSISIGGEANVLTNVGGLLIDMTGLMENNRLVSLEGTLTGPGEMFVISASVVDNGDTYTISGSGAFSAGPVQGSLSSQIETNSNFEVNPESLDISGDATVDTQLAGITINMTGVVENMRLVSLVGTFEGPNGVFLINVSVTDNGDSYSISGEGNFTAGPMSGTLGGTLETDNQFIPQIDTLDLNAEVFVDTEIAGMKIIMSGSFHNTRLLSLIGNVIGPSEMYNLEASVVDNGEGYTVTGGGEFTAGPLVGSVVGEINTDDNFNPQFDTINVSGEVSVDTNLAGNHIIMNGVMESNSLQSLIGTVEGPNGLYMLSVSVVDNGEGYTITGEGAFAAGPVEGTVIGEIGTDENFNPDFSTLNISGEASVDTEVALHKINMNGVMENGRLVSLEGTVVGPEELYTITASITDNGEGYTIIGDGEIDHGIVKGAVHGEINTDDNFVPDFETLQFDGEVTIESDSAGQKISGTAVVKNGYLESITATMEGPGGLYTLYASGLREEGGYDLEAGGEFTFFDAAMAFAPPPILIPVGIPGLYIEISADMEFSAKATAQLIAGIKTNPFFVPDINTFEIRAATLIGHGELAINLFGGISVNLAIASVSAGIKAQLKAIIDAYITLTADSKGFQMQGNLYGALMGALYAAIKMKFLFFKKEFDFLIIEGNVASVEKDFGPEEFTIENLIKAFAFGMEDLSLPGKERKGKTPTLEEQSKHGGDEVESAKQEDDNSKAEAAAAENEEDNTQLKSNPSQNSNGGIIQKKNGSPLPSNLKSGVEKLSGQDMSDVNVNYNSKNPEKLGAHAYAQGSNIDIAPGQEKHLPHEAWHVAQQKEGRVSPTKQLKSDDQSSSASGGEDSWSDSKGGDDNSNEAGKVQVNDDPVLEKEADEMGKKAEEVGEDMDENKEESETENLQNSADNSSSVSQLKSFSDNVNKNFKSNENSNDTKIDNDKYQKQTNDLEI